MSLRWRLAITVGLLLLTTVALVSVSAYLTTDRRLHEEVDTSLDDRAVSLRIVLNRQIASGRPATLPGAGRQLPQNAALAQLLAPNGSVVENSGGVVFPVSAVERRLANLGGRPVLRTVTVQGAPYRLETMALRNGGAVQVARELTPTRSTLASLRWRYAVSSGLVALLGAIVGWLLAGWLTRPVERLSDTAEVVATTGRLDVAVDTHGRDEISRLSRSFASMLAALRDSRLRQQQLAQDASHELRTPITSIRTNVDVLRRHPELDPAERAKVLDDVNDELTQVTTMVDELVTLASGTGELDDPTTTVRLDEIVKRAVERTRRRLGSSITLEAEPTELLGSPRGLDRAVQNLLDNAGKFGPAGAPIEVTLGRRRLEVRDHGAGIAPEDLANIFERFYRATTARTQPGSGLGLAIVSHVVEAHGGRVFAYNHPEGGAVVGFELGD